MELIKQIKEAENKAKKLVEDAQKYTSEAVENTKQERKQQLEQAARQRKEAITGAESAGEKTGLAEAEQLRKKSAQIKQQLEQKATAKTDTAVKTIIDFIKNQG
ncbi:MAG: hypothetical protein WCE45_07330 [Sedimentisphaerales bacterium]